MKGKIDKSRVMVGDFNTSVSAIVRTSEKMRKDIEESLDSSLDSLDNEAAPSTIRLAFIDHSTHQK